MSCNSYLYLIWKDPQTRRNFTVGKLCRGEKYTFEYCDEADEAVACGWNKLDAFSGKQVYQSDNLFPVFSSRLPDRKRRDIAKILEKYGLSEFDEFELLRKSQGRLPIDTYEFIDPIFSDEQTIEREFFVMGVRHTALCKGNDCHLLPAPAAGELLRLEEERDNPYDPFAIRVLTKEGVHLGYVPRYYNQAVLDRLKKGMSYSCEVVEVHPDGNCSECIKVRLNMPKKAESKHQ